MVFTFVYFVLFWFGVFVCLFVCFLCLFYLIFFPVLFIYLLYNIVLVLPYVDMNLHGCSCVFLILNPPPTSPPSHPSGSSQCASPEHPVSCIEPGLAIRFTHITIASVTGLISHTQQVVLSQNKVEPLRFFKGILVTYKYNSD